MANHPVLISYSSLDQQLAEKVTLALRERNISCWVGYENIRPGQSWPAAIAGAINECEIFLLILTRNSNSSRQVVRELTQADNLNKKLYCFQPDDIEISNDLQYFFSSIHRHEAFKTGFDKALAKMCDEVSLWLSSPSGKSLTPDQPLTQKKKSFFDKLQNKKIVIGSAVIAVALAVFFFRNSLWPDDKKPQTDTSSLTSNSSNTNSAQTPDTLPFKNDTSTGEKKETKTAEPPADDPKELARKKLLGLGISWSVQRFVDALVDEEREISELFLKGGMSVNGEKDRTSYILYAIQPTVRDREWNLRLFIKYGFDVNATLSDAKVMQRRSENSLPNGYETPLTPAGYSAYNKYFKGPLGLWLISLICYSNLQDDDETLIKIIAENGARFTIEKDYLKFYESVWERLGSYENAKKLVYKYSK